MSEKVENIVKELPKNEANPGKVKGFRQGKKGSKKDLQTENNVLKQALNDLSNQVRTLDQTNKFLSQQLFGQMNNVRQLTDQQQALSNFLRYTQVTEGVAEEGDRVVVDFSGILTQTGRTFRGANMLGAAVEIGEGKFLKEFEESIKGAKLGSTITATLNFPEDYPEELKGKEVEFTIKLVSLYKPNDNVELAKLIEAREKALLEFEKAEAEKQVPQTPQTEGEPPAGSNG